MKFVDPHELWKEYGGKVSHKWNHANLIEFENVVEYVLSQFNAR